MRERPILFSGPMVRAILAGQKTQTRRVAKEFAGRDDLDAVLRRFPNQSGCPYGQPGDRLWVREATIKVEDHGYEGPVYVESDDGRACLEGGLAPDPDDCVEVEPHELRIRPSIHMPRAWSRITLEIINVRVQQLQDISEADCIAEGIQQLGEKQGWATEARFPDGKRHFGAGAYDLYRQLWDSINGAGAWAANPHVWDIEFRRLTDA